MANQTEMILTRVLDDIEQGVLTPGSAIDEDALIEACGVSRTPLREAMIRLEAMGLIVRLPRKGATLFKPTLEQFVAILEVHAQLEGQAAGLAARRMSGADLAVLEQVVVDCEKHAAQKGDDDPDGYYQLNLRFHGTIAEGSGNPFLVDMIKTNARKLLAYYRARYQYAGAIADSAVEHRALFDLIAARKSDQAAAFMTRHVQFDQVTAMDLLAALG
ncbi:MAG: GntR family transcriptional regulator [Pelagimonas sp.]|uniref:GntR family transcriptional regulator n=1 Tax=Pelagimonas sp. TaxID=2073170 RepID=UPI003D6B96D0